jgi:hypothetical protein
MRPIRLFKRFFETFREEILAEREIEGRRNEPIAEAFRWIGLIATVALFSTFALWLAVSIIRWMWNHPFW